MDACLDSQSRTRMRVENPLQRAVQLRRRVTGERGSQETEGEGEGSRNKSNGGRGIIYKM